MISIIHQFKIIRAFLNKLIEGLTYDQLMSIPPNFNNNIWWNIGHLMISQQLLQYKLSKLPITISDEELAKYRKGSSPKDWSALPDEAEVDKFKKMLMEQADQLLTDYENKKFQEFETYQTTNGIVLTSIDDAIPFVNYHEGMHFTSILELKKYV